MTQTYFGYWNALEDVARDFDFNLDPALEVLFAIYHDPWGYSGQAFVIFRWASKLHFVEGSHCSCEGLERQWKPDETTAATLRHMNEKGSQFDYLPFDARAALTALIEQLSA